MAEKLQIYKCEKCGNIVEVLHGGAGELVCCGESMKLFVEKMADGFKVKVGGVEHPMEEKHYIEWIEIIADGKAYRQFLNPGQAPEAVFKIDARQITAREYCNIHGLWKG